MVFSLLHFAGCYSVQLHSMVQQFALCLFSYCNIVVKMFSSCFHNKLVSISTLIFINWDLFEN